ncbi:MAG: hypothetical protein KC621_13430 [Myxococcales bacterium]|nr:hypothetical protein [Myxococcales bacterium]
MTAVAPSMSTSTPDGATLTLKSVTSDPSATVGVNATGSDRSIIAGSGPTKISRASKNAESPS